MEKSKHLISTEECKHCKGEGRVSVYYKDCIGCKLTFKTHHQKRLYCEKCLIVFGRTKTG